MRDTRFFKKVPVVLLALLALCSLSSHAGTITLDVTSASGGTTGVGTTSYTKLIYTITNTGPTNLSVTNVTSSSSNFIVEQPIGTQLPVTILPGGAYIVQVAFKPASAGTLNGNITISSNDPAAPSTAVAATGIGGVEQSIRLTPLTPFEVELGQGAALRANVTFTNGATGIALLSWTSSSNAVATAAVGDIDLSFGVPVATGKVSSVATGTATITVTSVQTPSVNASVPITVVAATPHEFMASVYNDRIVRVKNGVANLCYDFPEVDINNDPIFTVSEIGVTTPLLNTIGSVYVAAQNAGVGAGADDVFYFSNNCGTRTTITNPAMNYVDPITSLVTPSSVRDIVVESTSNAVATNSAGSKIWQLTPTGSSEIARTGLPPDDVGALAIDSFDNLYIANLLSTTTQQEAAVYVRPFGSPTWFPVAAVFGTVTPSSEGVPGMAAIFEGNKGYAMKTVAFDKTVVERYIDVNGDFSFYKIVGTSIVPDPGEIVEVAVIDAGVDINVDATRNLIVSVSEPIGRAVVKMTDKNTDGDFKDAGEYKVLYQSNIFNRLVDIAFAAPCRDRPPTAVIGTLPLNGTVDINAQLLLTGGSSSDPCQDPLSYLWTLEDTLPATTLCTGSGCAYTCSGLPALHTIGLRVTDPAGNSNKVTKVIKCGPPAVNGFWPANGVTNSVVFVFGKNFKVASGALPTVCFNNGALCTPLVQVVAPDLLLVIQPVGTIQGKITVETAMGKVASAVDYNQVVTPGLRVNGIWPGEATTMSGSNIVFVFGQGYSNVVGATQVRVNGTLAPLVQVLDPNLLLFFVPPGATTGPVTVTVGAATATSPTNLVILP